jgi:foldase protein PrsA
MARASADPDVVVTVNEQSITRDAFYARLEQEAGTDILQQLISEALVLGYNKVKVTDSDMSKELARIKGNYASETDFQQALARYSVTPERLQQEIRMSIILRKLASEGVTVSDDEIKAFFESNKESLGSPEQVKVSHILVDSKEEADKLLAQLKKGADFATLAKENSKDPGTASRGGDLGYITPTDQIVPEFKDAAFSMKVGETSAPIKTQFGYHIIRVTAKSPAKPAEFDAQKEYIREQLIEEKSRSYDDVIADLRKQSKVQINWERYGQLATP